jgi:hypothetical protein
MMIASVAGPWQEDQPTFTVAFADHETTVSAW